MTDVFAARTINITWSHEDGAAGMGDALARICREASEAIEERVNIIVLSDRLVGPRRVPIPSLLAVKLMMRRWRRIGGATAATSAADTWCRPCRIAWALAARIRFMLARGPAPHVSSLLTKSAASGVPGRHMRVMRLA